MTTYSQDKIILKEEQFTSYSSIDFLPKVFGWMSVGVFITFLTSLFTAYTKLFIIMYTIPFAGIVLMLLQLGLVIGMSTLMNKLPKYALIAMFMFYSFITGLTLSYIFFAYSFTSVILTFFISSSMFAIMGLYGYFTKQDLTKFGNLALMGLLGLIMGSILNIFFKSSMLEWVFTYAGIAIFLVLIAWDTQKMKRLSNVIDNDKLAIIGALSLYLDFINLFLYLLRIFGGRRK